MAENKNIDKNQLLTEAGLNTVYRQYLKAMDIGTGTTNRPNEILTRERLSEAEKCFLDPQVSTCFLLLAFSLMKKKPTFKPIEEGLKKDINKSKKMADLLNFSLKKLAEGGSKQMIFDMFTAKFFGWSLIEKVYAVLGEDQSRKWNGYYYYSHCPSKRIGLWDFEFNEGGRVIGYKSLINRSLTWQKEKFMRISYLPLWGNPNGSPDFARVWKFWNAKCEFIIFLYDLGSRLSKGRQSVLKNLGTAGTQSQEEIDQLLEDLAENLNVYLPVGFDLTFHNFDVGALQYFLAVLRWIDSQIAIAMIGSSLAVNESQGAGTNAQSTVHMENTFTFEDYIEGIICDELDESYAKDLLKLNFSTSEYPEEIYPSASLVNDKEETPIEKANLYNILKNMGVLDTDTITDLNFLREEFNLPDNPELFDQVEQVINNAISKDPNQTQTDTASTITDMYK